MTERQTSTTIETLFRQLQTWAADHAPEVIFRPPATERAIDHFRVRSGLTLPDDLTALLRMADGETRASAGMIGNWRLLPVAEMQAAWGWLTQLSGKGAFVDRDVQAAPYLHPVWWHASWIPVVGDDLGNYFCVDSAPPEPERQGQIVLFFQDRPQRPLIAVSLSAWFERILQDLKSGVYHLDDVEGFDGEGFLWSALEGKHLLDGRGDRLIV